jgi:TRAP-type mannitol/chloroaromatic compound transport system permease large subunit
MDEREKQRRIERAERTISLLARLAISLVLPAWALVMVLLGLYYGSLWWIATGIAVGAIGAVLFAGSPLAERFLGDR